MLLRDRKGFTLVELIVVIAVLAILAGVAVPVYSGYIDKAHEAADLQLLDSMNTAFSAACAARGINPLSLSSEKVLVRGASGGKNAVGGITVLDNPVLSEALNQDFQLLFGDNANREFLTYGVEDISLEGGVFTHNGMSLSNRWNASNYRGNAEQLLGSLDNVSGAIADSDTLNTILNMLADNAEGDPDLEALAEALGSFPDSVKGYAVHTTERGNVAVLFIAQDSGKLNTETAYQDVSTVINDLKSFEVKDDLDSTISLLSSWGGDTTSLTKVSLACALATGFYNSQYFKNGNNGNATSFTGTSLSSALNYIKKAANSDRFAEYLNEEGRADVAAYLAAMSLLNQHSSGIRENLDDPAAFLQMKEELLHQLGVNA